MRYHRIEPLARAMSFMLITAYVTLAMRVRNNEISIHDVYLCNVPNTKGQTMQQTPFTDLFTGICTLKAGLANEGVRLTHNQLLCFLLIKEFMCADRRITITKREAFHGIIANSLDISRSTFNRAFNALVKKRCLLPIGVRIGTGWLGIGEEYRLTMVSKRVDALLKSSIAFAGL